MKKFLVAAIMAIMSLGAFAQDWYAGGSVGFWRNSGKNETTFNILPEIGYNLTNKVAVGAVVGYSYNYFDKVNRHLIEIDPYLRYSFYKNSRINVFVDGGVDLGFGVSKVDHHSSKTAVVFGVGFKPGIAYNFTDRFSIVAHVGFLGYHGGNKASHEPDTGGFYLDGNDLSFGLYYNF